MAHQDIRRLTNELDAAKNNNVEPSGTLQTCIPDYQVICTDSSYVNIFFRKGIYQTLSRIGSWFLLRRQHACTNMSTLLFLTGCRFLSATVFSYHTISCVKHIFCSHSQDLSFRER